MRLPKLLVQSNSGVEPKELAADISFALWTTAAGMAISIPLIVMNSAAQNKINGLQESVDEGLGPLLEDLAAARQRDGVNNLVLRFGLPNLSVRIDKCT